MMTNKAIKPSGLPVRSTAMNKSSPIIGAKVSSGFVIIGGPGTVYKVPEDGYLSLLIILVNVFGRIRQPGKLQ